MKRLPVICLCATLLCFAATLLAEIPPHIMRAMLQASQPAAGGGTVDYSPPTTCLAAYYKLDGTVKDAVSGVDGSPLLGPLWTNDLPTKLSTKDGFTSSFVAKTNYISTVSTTFLNGCTSATISVWLITKTEGNTRGPWCLANPSRAGYEYWNGYWNFYVNNTQYGWFDYAATDVWPLHSSFNTWKHYTVTTDAVNNQTIEWTNGLSAGTNASAPASWTQSTPLYIGIDGSSPYYFIGHIAQLCVWTNRILTPSEIYFLATGTEGPP